MRYILISVILLVSISQGQITTSTPKTKSQQTSSNSKISGTEMSVGSSVIRGTVTDPTGAVLVNATVTISNGAGVTKSTVSDGDGKYSISLPVGSYTLSVKMAGFKESKFDNLILEAGAPVSLELQLEPEGSKTELTVEAQKVTQIETENNSISGTITEEQVLALPPNGRNFSSLITLAPGVSNQTGQDEAKVGVVGSAKYSVNGGRVEYNTFEVDGSDVLNTDIAASHGHVTLEVYPSLDAIQEIKVLTSNYGAQFGRTASGTVQVTTKSGSSNFHGNAYAFLRNEMFDGHNYFDTSTQRAKDRRLDFGVTLGGPVVIPGISHGKGKTFFFLSEEVRREANPLSFNQAVPSDAERGWNPVTQSYTGVADFSDVCPPGSSTFNISNYPNCPSRGPQNNGRSTYPDSKVTIDPTAQAILQTGLIPRANSTAGCSGTLIPEHKDSSGNMVAATRAPCYSATISPTTYWREELVRFDHTLGSSTKLSARGIHDHWDTTTAVPQWADHVNSFPSVLNAFDGPGTSVVIGLTSTLSPTLLNVFSLGATYQHITLQDEAGSGVTLSRAGLDQLNSPMGSLFNNGSGGKLPAIIIAGNNSAYGGAGFSVDPSYMPWYHKLLTGALRDDISKVVGKHTIQFGGQFVRANRSERGAANGANSGDVEGQLTFNNVASVNSTRNAFADFLVNLGANGYSPQAGGAIQQFQQDSRQVDYKVKYWLAEPYIQDDWRVNNKLTLNLGVRLSLFGNWQPVNKTLYNWQLGAYDPTLMSKEDLRVYYYSGYLQTPSVGGSSGTPLLLNPNSLDPVLTNGLVRCGQGGISDSCQTSHVLNPAPRLGFALDPHGNGKTSIRGGYGIFYEHGTGSEANAGSLMGNPPDVLSMSTSFPSNYYSIGRDANGNPVQYAYPLNMVSIPSKTTWPYVQQWSLGVQGELTKDTTATLSYVGSKGTHLVVAMQVNQLPPVSSSSNPYAPGQPITSNDCDGFQGSYYDPFDPNGYFLFADGSTLSYQGNRSAFLGLLAACDGTQATARGNPISFDLNVLRPYAGIGKVLAIRNAASSVYHSMQFTLRHHRKALDLSLSYTYGHSIDSASDRYSSTFVDAYDLRANRSSSDFDQRHLLNVSYVYQLPLLPEVLHNLNRCYEDNCEGQVFTPYSGPSYLTKMLLGGWSLSGITTIQTGTPFSVISGSSSTGISALDNAGLAIGAGADSYPDVVHGVACDTRNSSVNTFGPLLGNPCNYVAPRGLTQGNAGRNSLNNPGRVNFDMALFRNFKLLNESNLQFRLEAFNLFNMTQFIIYDPAKGNTSSNTISCYNDPSVSASNGYNAGSPSCLTGSGFLHPISAHSPRRLQMGLKFDF